MKQIIGIVGGTGPLASTHLCSLLTELHLVKSDQDHVPFVHISHPQIPDRSAFLRGEGENPTAAIVSVIERLQQAGATMACVACNTAHAPQIYDEISRKSPLPLVNLVATTADFVISSVPNAKTVGILGTTGTVSANVYALYFERHQVAVKYLQPDHQQQVMRTIYEIKASGPTGEHSKLITALSGTLLHSGCDAVVLGCTELSLLDYPTSKVMFDPVRILAEHLLERAA